MKIGVVMLFMKLLAVSFYLSVDAFATSGIILAIDDNSELGGTKPSQTNLNSSQKRSISDYVFSYKNVEKLDDYFTVIFAPGNSEIGSPSSHKIDAELKVSDEKDSSIALFMHRGPIKFYLPTNDISSLPPSGWHYEACSYSLAGRSGTNYIDKNTNEISKNLAWTIVVEAVCNDIPHIVSRYYFSEYKGLLAFSISEKLQSGSHGDNDVAKAAYFLITPGDGFGSRPDKPF